MARIRAWSSGVDAHALPCARACRSIGAVRSILEEITVATLFVRHPVSDYAVWKRAYDEVAPLRKSHGVTGASVHRDASDPNVVVVTHRFATAAAASGFMALEGLKSAMQKAGVSGPPVFWVTEDVEATAN
jgi:quinol monooxygenase YgiN